MWHNALITIYDDSQTWGDLSDDDNGYGWRWLIWHLHQAMRMDDLRSLLFNASYLQHKIARMTVASLVSDFAYVSHERDLRHLMNVLIMGRKVLDETPQELPNQIRGHSEFRLFERLHHWPNWSQPHLRLVSSTLDQARDDLLRIMPHQGKVNQSVFSPDGCYALSASEDGTLRLWDVQTGKSVRTFLGHTGAVRTCTFSPDGRYALSSALLDNTLRAWEINTGQEIMEWKADTLFPV